MHIPLPPSPCWDWFDRHGVGAVRDPVHPEEQVDYSSLVRSLLCRHVALVFVVPDFRARA